MSMVHVLALAAASSPAAGVGTGPFHVPASAGHRPVSSDAHLVFRKPAGWPRDHGMEDQPSLGTFSHVVDLPRGGICTLRLDASAEAARRPPTLTGRDVHSESGVIRVRRRGRDGSMRWIRGRVDDGTDAARGARPLTPGHAPARYAWVIVDIDLSR